MIQGSGPEAPAFEIPIVDLSDDLQTVGSALDSAYSNIGFCQVIGHGLDPELEASAWALSQEFFAPPPAREGPLFNSGWRCLRLWPLPS